MTHLERTPIDAERAARQHAAYEQALSDAGFAIHRLPGLPDDPDAVFVEDIAILLGPHAILTRPGAASRLGEVDATAAGLEPHFELHRITSGHVDGGDVLRIGQRLYAGRSTRTDIAGIAALAELAGPLGFKVVEARLRDCLHLKSGATFAGRDGAGRPVLLYSHASIDPVQFAGVDPLATDPNESAAANCVRAGEILILPAGNPRTADRLRQRGFNLAEVDVSELQKAEAGVTCMSLIDD